MINMLEQDTRSIKDVSLEQFKSLSYNELIDMVTGYAEFIKDYQNNRRG
jgi:hypothetical protein